MSMITECTIVVPPSLCEAVEADLKVYEGDMNPCVFKNSDLAIYVFDSDGDSCFEIIDQEDLKTPYEEIMALETNYLDREPPWTRLPKEGKDSDTPISEWIADKVTPNELDKIRKSIEYSVNWEEEEER